MQDEKVLGGISHNINWTAEIWINFIRPIKFSNINGEKQARN